MGSESVGLVISDTSPVNYLVRLGKAELFPMLFGAILIPNQVLDELRHPGAPPEVRRFVEAPPTWMLSAPVVESPIVSESLDLGERAAISLALERNAERILLDETLGRLEAKKLGF